MILRLAKEDKQIEEPKSQIADVSAKQTQISSDINRLEKRLDDLVSMLSSHIKVIDEVHESLRNPLNKLRSMFK
mgnify:FL=1